VSPRVRRSHPRSNKVIDQSGLTLAFVRGSFSHPQMADVDRLSAFPYRRGVLRRHRSAAATARPSTRPDAASRCHWRQAVAATPPPASRNQRPHPRTPRRARAGRRRSPRLVPTSKRRREGTRQQARPRRAFAGSIAHRVADALAGEARLRRAVELLLGCLRIAARGGVAFALAQERRPSCTESFLPSASLTQVAKAEPERPTRRVRARTVFITRASSKGCERRPATTFRGADLTRA
jgi:hypothetical protein